MKHLTIGLGCLALSACATAPEAWSPRVAPTSDRINNYGQVIVPPGALVVFQGDDLFYGTRPQRRPAPDGAVSQSRHAPPMVAARALGGSVKVEARTHPGDTVRAGAARWAGKPFGAVLVLSYAYGDALAKTPRDQYKAALSALVAQARSAGAVVFLVPPPNSDDGRLTDALNPYRDVMRELRAPEVLILEGGALLGANREPQTRTVGQTDGAYRAIAGGVVTYVRVAPRP